MASSIAQWGNLALACGDFNSFAPGGPVLTEQQLREMDPHLRPARMIVEDGRFRPDYTVHARADRHRHGGRSGRTRSRCPPPSRPDGHRRKRRPDRPGLRNARAERRAARVLAGARGQRPRALHDRPLEVRDVRRPAARIPAVRRAMQNQGGRGRQGACPDSGHLQVRCHCRRPAPPLKLPARKTFLTPSRERSPK